MANESSIYLLKLEILKAAIDRCNWLKIKHEYTSDDILKEYTKMENVIFSLPIGFTGQEALGVK